MGAFRARALQDCNAEQWQRATLEPVLQPVPAAASSIWDMCDSSTFGSLEL